VLIHGAGGGVGHLAVQIAKWRGAHVIAPVAAAEVDRVAALGADEAFDREATPFEEAGREVDLVFDTAGGERLARSPAMAREGLAGGIATRRPGCGKVAVLWVDPGVIRRGALTLCAACMLAGTAGSPARAGTYHVVACSDGGATNAPIPNNGWRQVPATAPTGLEAFVSCPPQGSDQHDGIVAQDRLPVPPKPASRVQLYWRFAAPAGTSITRISVVRSLGKVRDQDWRPFGRADGAIFDTCRIASGRDACERSGRATFAFKHASTIDYGVRCDASSGGCVVGSTVHHVWMSLYSADVSLDDPSAPKLTGGPSGPLWHADGWHRGTESASFGGTDNTGISEADWFVDGRQQTADRGACDTSRPIPCADMTPTGHGLDTAAVGDGSHRLQAVIKDAAGNQATAGPLTLKVDNTPPGAPAALTAAPAGDGSFTAAWSNPDGQVAPIARAHYRFCPAASTGRFCRDEQTASGDNISSIAGLRLPTAGVWSLIIWLEDAAGNVGTNNTSLLVLGPGQTGVPVSAELTLDRAKLDRRHRLVVRGTTAADLATTLAVRYRYRPRQTPRASHHHQARRRAPWRLRRPPHALARRPTGPQRDRDRQLRRRHRPHPRQGQPAHRALTSRREHSSPGCGHRMSCRPSGLLR
jgi:zinc-binding dehydrogenase